MTVRQSTNALQHDIARRFDIGLSFDDANTLRRAQLALHRWGELECGDGRGYIQRDDETGVPFYTRTNHSYLDPYDPRARSRIPDREAGALRRIAEVCKRNGLHYYHQTDPRGCALYVAREVLTDQNYSGAGLACCE